MVCGGLLRRSDRCTSTREGVLKYFARHATNVFDRNRFDVPFAPEMIVETKAH